MDFILKNIKTILGTNGKLEFQGLEIEELVMGSRDRFSQIFNTVNNEVKELKEVKDEQKNCETQGERRVGKLESSLQAKSDRQQDSLIATREKEPELPQSEDNSDKLNQPCIGLSIDSEELKNNENIVLKTNSKKPRFLGKKVKHSVKFSAHEKEILHWKIQAEREGTTLEKELLNFYRQRFSWD